MKQTALTDTPTRELILKSARKQFLERGFQGASIRRIASDAGVTYGALYGYFASKEELFYAITDPLMDRIMKKLDEIEGAMLALPAEERLLGMSDVFYVRLPELVALIFEDREIVNMVIGGAKGTKYESFMSELVKRDAHAISAAAENSETPGVHLFDAQTLEIMMEGYMAALFHLIESGRDQQEVSRSMEIFGRIYEAGMLALMKDSNNENRSGGIYHEQ